MNRLDAEILRKAQAYDRIVAQEQVASLDALKDDEPARVKALTKIWIGGDGEKYFKGEVLELSAKEARQLIAARQAEPTDEPVTPAAVERVETLRGQREYSTQQWELRKRQMAAIEAVTRGEF